MLRELPGDDIEFGFPGGPGDTAARPENRAALGWWESADGPFAMHASLHGMGFGAGPWFLIESAWVERCGDLMSSCAEATEHLPETEQTKVVTRRRGGAYRYLAMGFGALAVATLFAETFGLGDGGDGALSIDLTIEDLDPVVADIERRTGQGGSAVDSTAITALSDLPSALTRVLFAPYLWQAHNAQALFAALDGAVMAGVFAWALPAIVRAFGSYRRHPYVLMASIYMVGFIVAFSAILNLGIMTRQRAQVTAAFLTLCFGTRELIVERQTAKRIAELEREAAELAGRLS